MQCYYVTAVCEVFDVALVYCPSLFRAKTMIDEALRGDNKDNNQRKKYKVVTSTHHSRCGLDTKQPIMLHDQECCRRPFIPAWK